MYPYTKVGGDRKSEEIKRRNPTFEKPSFVADTSTRTGKSQRAIEKERARKRMSEAAKTQRQGKEIFPCPQKGQTRDKVAKAIAAVETFPHQGKGEGKLIKPYKPGLSEI